MKTYSINIKYIAHGWGPWMEAGQLDERGYFHPSHPSQIDEIGARRLADAAPMHAGYGTTVVVLKDYDVLDVAKLLHDQGIACDVERGYAHPR